MANEQVLVVDDDDMLRESIKECLIQENMIVTTLSNGKEVLPTLQSNKYDIVLLDLLLGSMDGFEILKDVRKMYPTLPVFIMSSKKALHNKVLGLGLGADDYITKPFDEYELIARIKRTIERTRTMNQTAHENTQFLEYSSLRLDTHSLRLFKNNSEIQLNARMYKLLKLFMEQPERVFSKEQIYNNVWDDGYFDDNLVMTYIRKLRTTIEDNPNKPTLIITIRGMGYKLANGS